MSLSNAVENDLLDHLMMKTSMTQYTNIYVSLHSADPGETGSNELSGNAYARVSTSASDWDAASSGVVDNANAITFPTATGAWSAATHFGLYSASSGGTFIGGGALTASKTAANGDTIKFNAGDLDVSMD